MNRRGFLSSCLALAAAPAIVRADSLMRIVPRNVEVLTYAEYSWTQITSAPIIVDCTEGFAEIVARTFKERHAEIAESIKQRNAMLRLMIREQLGEGA